MIKSCRSSFSKFSVCFPYRRQIIIRPYVGLIVPQAILNTRTCLQDRSNAKEVGSFLGRHPASRCHRPAVASW